MNDASSKAPTAADPDNLLLVALLLVVAYDCRHLRFHAAATDTAAVTTAVTAATTAAAAATAAVTTAVAAATASDAPCKPL